MLPHHQMHLDVLASMTLLLSTLRQDISNTLRKTSTIFLRLKINIRGTLWRHLLLMQAELTLLCTELPCRPRSQARTQGSCSLP